MSKTNKEFRQGARVNKTLKGTVFDCHWYHWHSSNFDDLSYIHQTDYFQRDSEDVFSCGVSVAPVSMWELYDSIYTER